MVGVQGMVDPGDNISITLRKEFAEEAMNCLEVNERDQKNIAKLLARVFTNGFQVRYTLLSPCF